MNATFAFALGLLIGSAIVGVLSLRASTSRLRQHNRDLEKAIEVIEHFKASNLALMAAGEELIRAVNAVTGISEPQQEAR